jgi:hypothetical protein
MTKGPLSVRRLHVTSAAPLASRVGFVARMEDALRTSSPPSACKGRLVLLRRLRLRAGEGCGLLARRIEAAWQMMLRRRAGDHGHAPAVQFAGEARGWR